MNKYYKIPMTERVVSVGERSLYQILQDNYPELYNRELGRVELTYGGENPGVMSPELESIVDEYNQETTAIYKAAGIPQYIIGFVGQDGTLVEYSTKTPLLMRSNFSFIFSREVSQQEAYRYLDEEPNYISVTDYLFSPKKQEKHLMKRLISAITTKLDN